MVDQIGTICKYGIPTKLIKMLNNTIKMKNNIKLQNKSFPFEVYGIRNSLSDIVYLKCMS